MVAEVETQVVALRQLINDVVSFGAKIEAPASSHTTLYILILFT